MQESEHSQIEDWELPEFQEPRRSLERHLAPETAGSFRIEVYRLVALDIQLEDEVDRQRDFSRQMQEDQLKSIKVREKAREGGKK